MVICKLDRPSINEKYSLTLYCFPSVVSEVLSKLNEDQLLDCKVEFIKVVTDEK